MCDELPYFFFIIIEDLFNLKDIPIINIGRRTSLTHYIDFITIKELSSPIMKGIDYYKRPFLTFRVINNITKELSVHTIFQRYPNKQEPWCCTTLYKKIVNVNIGEKYLEFLSRLFGSEKCGENIMHEEGPLAKRETDTGESILQIY